MIVFLNSYKTILETKVFLFPDKFDTPLFFVILEIWTIGMRSLVEYKYALLNYR
jgi:hypothetical protein